MINKFLDVIFINLSKGGPLSRIWVLYVGVGGMFIGLFSIPSKGSAIILIPLFIISGLTILCGAMLSSKKHDRYNGRRIIAVGLSLMSVAGWTRAIVLWGTEQHGAGSNVLPTLVWVWITIGLVMLLITTWTRGVQ